MNGDKDIESQIPESEETGNAGDDLDFAIESTEDSAEEGDFGASDDFVEEDWESYEEEEYMEDGGVDEEAAARSKRFNNIVIGIAFVVALGVGGYKMFSGQPPAQPAPANGQQPYQMAEFSTGAEKAPPAPYGIPYGKPVPKDEGPSSEKKPSAGLINNPSAFQQIRRGEPVPYETGQTGTEEQQITERQPYPSPNITEGQPPMPAPIASVTTGGQENSETENNLGLIPMPFETSSEAQESNYQEFEMPQNNAAASMDIDADQTASSSPFDDTRTMMGPTETQPSPPTISVELEEKFNLIIERLDTIEETLARIDDEQESLEERFDKIEKQDKIASRPSRKAKSRQSLSSSTPAQISSSGTKWILKSAQPGQAMVAKSGQNDMVSIRVGESLSGIGRITSISVQDGRWVVQGTNGKITQ